MKHKIQLINSSCKDLATNLDDLFELDKSNDKNHWSRDNFNGNHKIKIATCNNKTIGFIVYSDFDTVEILRLLVVKDFRGKGVGASLIESIYNKDIILEVRKDNENAISLYKKYGFQVINIRKNYYKDGEDAFIMQIIKSN
jgi:ribosomal-protein-alanine N-acetyltransferase